RRPPRCPKGFASETRNDPQWAVSLRRFAGCIFAVLRPRSVPGPPPVGRTRSRNRSGRRMPASHDPAPRPVDPGPPEPAGERSVASGIAYLTAQYGNFGENWRIRVLAVPPRARPVTWPKV